MTEKQVRAYLALLKKTPTGPSKATHDRYGIFTRFEAVYRFTHGGRPRPSSDGVPPG